MKRTIMTPVAIGAALVLGLAGCGEDDGTVVVEETVLSTETETEEVEEEVVVEPTETITETD